MRHKHNGILFFLFGLIFSFLSAPVHAGSPVWTFTPLTATTISVPGNGSAPVQYTVTNNSSKSHTLAMTPIAGITQITSGTGVCGNPFTLPGKGSSCTLSLLVSGSQLTGPVSDGPIVCDQGSVLQCYRPSFAASLNVTTTTNEYTVGGTITGLTGTVTLLNNGTNELTTSTDGNFTFTTALTDGSDYAVTVLNDPSDQTCTVNYATGMINGANVTNVSVTCSTDTYTVGGTVSGLSGTVVLQNNGTNALSVTSNGDFTFTTPIAQGSTYSVTVQTQPATQTCTVSQGSGTMMAGNVTTVIVTCSTNTYTVGGRVSGLSGTVVLQNNGLDSLPTSSNGSFTFLTPVAQGSLYSVTVGTQPSGQTCTVSNGSGTMGGANVTNVGVACVSNNTTLSVSSTGTIPVYLTSGTPGSLTITNTGSAIAQNVSATLPGGWTGVTQDARGCTAIPVSGSCTLRFHSNAAYVAQGGITITGTNIDSPPTTALAFTINNYLVWAVTGDVSQVIDTDNIANAAWGTGASFIGANSLTDGVSNTAAIHAVGGPTAGNNCYNSNAGGSPGGTWYLPAICQMGAASQGAGCVSGLPNIYTNLWLLGFGNLNPEGIQSYWSSTESSAPAAYYMGFRSGSNLQQTTNKTNTTNVRCARSITPS